MSIPPPDVPDPRLALRPVVTLSYEDDRLVVAWTPIELAYGYRITVTAADGFEYRAEASQSPLTCDFVPGRGIAYAVVVEAVGMPSESVTLTAPDALLILRAQRDRLVATRTTEGVHTFGPEVVAEDDVRTLIGGFQLTTVADPVLDEVALTLTVSGTSTDLAGVEAPAVLVFTVSPDYLLRATWTARPGAGYRLADTFESLQGGDYAYLELAGPTFVATTFAHRDPEIFFQLQPGLSFQAGVAVPAGTPTRVGGPLTVDAGGEPGFTWAGESPLGTVTIQPTGQPALALTGGLVTLTPAELLISGSVLLGQVSAHAELDFPTFATPTPALRIVRPPLAGTTATALLEAIGLDDAVGERLPAGLLALAGASVSELTIVAALDGSEPTVTVLTLDLGDWAIAAGLSLRDFRLEATVRQADGFPPSTGVVVYGTLDLGTVTYDIEAGAFAESPWYLEIDQAATVNAADLTKLAGNMTTATATSVLPASLFAGFPLTVTHAAVLADPAAATLVEVEFTIAQTTAWHIARILTVHDWAATISIAKDKTGRWQPTALLSGTVTIGGADFAVSVSAPPGDDLWTLSLEEGSEIRLPSLSSLLALLGGDAHLPGGLGDLGDLTITDFRIALDQGLTAVAFLFVRIEQSSDWVVIPGTGTSLLKLQDFAASLSVAPDGSAGFLQGTLVVGRMPVDAGLVKNGPGEDWMLRAAYTDRIQVPGWNTLEGWLAPSTAGASLPSEMPLGDGFELTRVWLRFADANGVLTELGFTLYAAKPWSVSDGRFELSRVRGELSMPWPIRAETIVARLGAVLTLGGVDIGIAAVKPGENLPWEFSGSLLNGLTIDLIAAAQSVDSVTGLRLPSDALANGLPASITIESAALRVVPDTGELHFAGFVGTDWTVTIAETDFSVTSLGGAVDIAATGAPMVARVTGTFGFASVVAKISLLLGTMDTPTILTGVVEPDDLDDVDLGTVTAMGGTTGTWAAVVPRDLPEVGFTGVTFALDLTGERFLLYGAMGYSTLAAEATVPTDYEASGLVYCAPEADGWSYAVAVGLGPGFTFGELFTPLRAIDAILTVQDAVLVLCDLPEGSTLRAVLTAMKGTLDLVNPDAASPLAVLDGLPHPAPPAPVVDPLAMTQGAYFAARLDFSSPLMSKVLQIGRDHTPPSVLLFALIDHASSANTVFGAQLPDIVVLSTVKFTELALLYHPNLKNQVELTGSVGLTGVFDSAYTFDVTLVVNEVGLTATVEQSTHAIVNPFYLPGVELSKLSMEIGYTWTPATSSYALTGQALLGPIPAAGAPDDRASFKGTMALVNGKAELFEIAVNRDLSIGRLLAALVTGSGAHWPSDYLDIVFYDGTFVRYATAAGAAANTAYTTGLVVKAKMRLTLLVSLDLSLDVTFSKALETDTTYSVMDAKVALLTPIDLLFVQLSGQGFTGGPKVKIHTGAEPSLGLFTAMTFLGVDFGTTDITLRKGADGGTIIDGDLKTEIDVYPFGKLGCTFTYTTHPDRDSELTVTGWPTFSWIREMFDVFATIRSLAGSGCGELTKLFASVAYHTTFDLTPAIRLEGANLVFTLTGTYSFTVNGARHPFLSVDLPPMRVEVATSTTWHQLPERIALEFALAAPRLVADLLNDPEKIAVLVGMLVAQETMEAALQLVCEGLVEGAVAAAVEAAATAAATLGRTMITAVEVLASVTDSLTESDESSGGGSGGGGGSGTTTPAVPVLKRLTYASGKVTATWDAASRANGYTYELLDPDGRRIDSHDYTTILHGDIAVRDDLPVGVYHGRVRAYRTEESTVSDWSALPLVKSPAPVAALALGESGVVVSWTDVTDADHYEVRVNGVVTQAAGTLRELVLTPEPGELVAEVRAVRAAELPGDWSARATFDLLPTPTGLTLRQDVAQLKATWTSPADQFTIEMDGEVRTAGPDPSMTFDPPFTEGAVHTFRVRATSTAGASRWSAPVAFTYASLPEPGEITIGQDGQAFLLSWPPPVLPPAVPSVSFLAQLWFGYGSMWVTVDENGNVIDQGSSFSEVVQGEAAGPYTGEAVRLSTNDGTLPPGSEFPLRVRYSTPDRTGPWTQTSARALDQVQIREASYAGESVHVAWDPMEGGSYEVQMEPGDLLLTPGTGTSVDVSADELSPGTVYAFRVRPTVGDRLGVWSEPPARVAVLDPPSAVTVSYENGQITVGWQQVDGAQRYRVAVLNTYGYELRTTESQTEPVTIDAAGLPRLHGLGVKVVSLLDDLSSADSPTTLFDLIDPPADLTADWDGLRTRLTWSPVDGAAQYRVRLLNAQGTVLRAAVTTQTSAELLVAGETAQVRVVGQTWSAPVPVARYTVLPVSGNGPAILRVSEHDLDNVYKPTQTPVRTGWVAAVQGQGGPLSVLALLTAALVKAGSFTQAQAYAALRAGTEHPIADEAGGAYTTLCLGTTPGGACGAGTPHAEFGGVIQGVTGGQLDELYAIFRADRSGWVGALTAPNGALDAILQLDVLLTAKGVLTGNAPYQVFNGSLTAPFAREGAGPQVCVAFGTATNLTGTALPGARGSVVFGVTDERVPIYMPSAQNRNWLAFPDTPTLPLTLLLRLVRLLSDRGVLTGTEPYDVFNTRVAPPPVPGD
ncbi:hypothetical protein ACIBG8_14520 [Nonomuraea sp. NPDC050556]|uniref:hypothetical protein n=1 Tax=Nonomuraea sp. NPDC050556 TaxID=3364369 RepID=UPI00379ADF50